MATTVLGSLLVQLGMDSAQFDRGISRAQNSMRNAERQFTASGRNIQASNGRMQSGMQQLSFQLNDIATQWASGTRPMQIFAQQSGQVVQAISLMSNGAGKFGAFMAGPWGMMLTAGVVVLSGLISKLGETSSALDNVKFASSAVGDAQGILGNVMDLTTGKITTQTTALVALAKAQLLVAKVQAQARAAEARRGVQDMQSRSVQIGGGMGGGVSFSRRPQDARDFISAEVLSGRMDGATAVQRLENLRKAGQITDEQFATYASSVANLGAEEANIGVYEEGLKLLDGTGGKSLLKPTKAKNGKKGKTSEQIQRQFNAESAGFIQQYNSAMASMAMSAEEAADFELRNLELQRIRTNEAIRNNEDYSSAQKKQLIAQNEEVAELERQQIERNKQRRLEQEADAASRQEYQAQRDALQIKLQMAKTESERKAISLELLDLDQQFRRNGYEQIIASNYRTEAEKALAKKALDGLSAVEAAEREQTSQGNQTRAQAYFSSLQKTPEQINEAIDNIKVDALESFNDQLVNAIVNFKSLGDVAQSVLKQILADLLRLQVQKSITAPLAQLLGLGGALGGGGSSIAAPTNTFSSWASDFIAGKRANGGPVHIGRSYLVGERGPEIFTPSMTGRIIANDDIQGGGARVQVIPSPYFDVVVNGHIQRAAPSIAGLGAAEANVRSARMSSRRIG